MNKILFILAIMLTGTPSSYAQIKTSHTKTRAGDGAAPTGDGTAPIGTGTNDSLAIMSDITSTYNAMEQDIEMAFNKLMQGANNNMDELKSQAKAINEQIKEVKAETEKLAALQKKISDLAQLIQQMNQENKNGILDLEKQKTMAIRQASDLIRQKRPQDIPAFVRTIKTLTVKAGQDSVQSITRRYSMANH